MCISRDGENERFTLKIYVINSKKKVILGENY